MKLATPQYNKQQYKKKTLKLEKNNKATNLKFEK